MLNVTLTCLVSFDKRSYKNCWWQVSCCLWACEPFLDAENAELPAFTARSRTCSVSTLPSQRAAEVPSPGSHFSSIPLALLFLGESLQNTLSGYRGASNFLTWCSAWVMQPIARPKNCHMTLGMRSLLFLGFLTPNALVTDAKGDIGSLVSIKRPGGGLVFTQTLSL